MVVVDSSLWSSSSLPYMINHLWDLPSASPLALKTTTTAAVESRETSWGSWPDTIMFFPVEASDPRLYLFHTQRQRVIPADFTVSYPIHPLPTSPTPNTHTIFWSLSTLNLCLIHLCVTAFLSFSGKLNEKVSRRLWQLKHVPDTRIGRKCLWLLWFAIWVDPLLSLFIFFLSLSLFPFRSPDAKCLPARR